MAPVVDFQGGFGQRQAADAGAEGVGIPGAEVVQRLVVHPEGEDEVPEFPFGNVPGHLPANLQRLLDIGFPIAPALFRAVSACRKRTASVM